MPVWIYIILSALCSLLVAHLLKLSETKKLRTLPVLTINYITASFIAFLSTKQLSVSGTDVMNIPALFLALIVGILFISNYFFYSKSVYQNGMGISVAMMRLSLVIPVFLSIFWYQEYLRLHQWIGVVLVFLSLFLLLPDKQQTLYLKPKASWLLVLLFLFTGLGDATLKMYESDFSQYVSKHQFMSHVYLFSSLAGILILSFRGNWTWTKQEIKMGILVGLPNLFAALFLIDALTLLDGGIVYPSINVLTVSGAALLGFVLWNDHLSVKQLAGLGVTILAILLIML